MLWYFLLHTQTHSFSFLGTSVEVWLICDSSLHRWPLSGQQCDWPLLWSRSKDNVWSIFFSPSCWLCLSSYSNNVSFSELHAPVCAKKKKEICAMKHTNITDAQLYSKCTTAPFTPRGRVCQSVQHGSTRMQHGHVPANQITEAESMMVNVFSLNFSVLSIPAASLPHLFMACMQCFNVPPTLGTTRSRYRGLNLLAVCQRQYFYRGTTWTA